MCRCFLFHLFGLFHAQFYATLPLQIIFYYFKSLLQIQIITSNNFEKSNSPKLLGARNLLTLALNTGGSGFRTPTGFSFILDSPGLPRPPEIIFPTFYSYLMKNFLPNTNEKWGGGEENLALV